MARTYLAFWEDPTTRASLTAVLRSAMTHDTSAGLLREFVVHQLWAHLGSLVGVPRANLRVELAASQLIGVAVLYYILQVEPIASADQDELVAWLTPALTNYLEPNTFNTLQSAGPG